MFAKSEVLTVSVYKHSPIAVLAAVSPGCIHSVLEVEPWMPIKSDVAMLVA